MVAKNPESDPIHSCLVGMLPELEFFCCTLTDHLNTLELLVLLLKDQPNGIETDHLSSLFRSSVQGLSCDTESLASNLTVFEIRLRDSE
jgi:hypothetical protein